MSKLKKVIIYGLEILFVLVALYIIQPQGGYAFFGVLMLLVANKIFQLLEMTLGES